MILRNTTPKPVLALFFAAIPALPLSITACSKPTEEATQATIDSIQAEAATANAAEATAGTAQTDAQLMASGQWRDPATGLIWMRCSLGQKWIDSTCKGEASKHNWQAAQDAVKAMNRNGGFGGHTDWVVPHIEDLSSIRYCSTGFEATKEIPSKAGGEKTIDGLCNDGYQRPTIDRAIFPNTPEDWYWSASPSAGSLNGTWLVHFGYGYSYGYSRLLNYPVRVVRASQ